MEELEQKFDIIKNIIEVSAVDVSKMSTKELRYFSYVIPEEIKYEKIDLPIDPYYVGFWLGDGHSSSAGTFTCGGETKNGGCNDQKFILPYMEKVANSLNLELKPITKNATISFCMIDSNKKEKTTSNNRCFAHDWLEETIKVCKDLEISKNISSAYNNFRINYNPCKKYLRDDANYYCNLCSFTTKGKLYKRQNVTQKQSKQYSMREHLRGTHNINMPKVVDGWNKLTTEEKNKWKINIKNKQDICEKSKYYHSGSVLTKMYKLFEKGGVNA